MNGTTACKWDIIIPFEPMWKELKRITKDRSAIVLFGTEPFSSHLRLSNLNEYKYDWIWDKKRISNPMLAKKQPLRQHEVVSVFYSKQCCYNPVPYIKNTEGALSKKNKNKPHNTETLTKITYHDNSGKIGYPRSLLTQIKVINNLSKDKSGLHPTQKPVALMEYLIKTYTNKGQTVLDFTCGSGTTGVACQNLDRKYIMIEKDDKYFNDSKERLLENDIRITYGI